MHSSVCGETFLAANHTIGVPFLSNTKPRPANEASCNEFYGASCFIGCVWIGGNTTGGSVFPGCQLHSEKEQLHSGKAWGRGFGEEAHGEAAFPECQKLHTRGRLHREAKKHSGEELWIFKKSQKALWPLQPAGRPPLFRPAPPP
jgi:hypothetical protein